MDQMICPVMDSTQAMEGFDTSDRQRALDRIRQVPFTRPLSHSIRALRSSPPDRPSVIG